MLSKTKNYIFFPVSADDNADRTGRTVKNARILTGRIQKKKNLATWYHMPLTIASIDEFTSFIHALVFTFFIVYKFREINRLTLLSTFFPLPCSSVSLN